MNMKKICFFILVVSVLSLFAGCATFATNQEVPQKTIPILSFIPKSKPIFGSGIVPAGTEMASYYKVFGFCLNYDAFTAQVSGSDYDVVETFYFVFSKISAISK